MHPSDSLLALVWVVKIKAIGKRSSRRLSHWDVGGATLVATVAVVVDAVDGNVGETDAQSAYQEGRHQPVAGGLVVGATVVVIAVVIGVVVLVVRVCLRVELVVLGVHKVGLSLA